MESCEGIAVFVEINVRVTHSLLRRAPRSHDKGGRRVDMLACSRVWTGEETVAHRRRGGRRGEEAPSSATYGDMSVDV